MPHARPTQHSFFFHFLIDRHLDSDVLLGLLRGALKDYPHLRVILMSATLDADRFAAYWGENTPRIHIPGRTFPVTDYMLEDVLSITGYIPPKKKKKKNFQRSNGYQNPKKSSPWADSEKSDEEEEDLEENPSEEPTNQDSSKKNVNSGPSIPLDELIARVNESDLDYDLVAQLVKHLVINKSPENDGSILIFLAGAPEIQRCMETIQKVARNLPLQILPLHGGLQPKDQRLVFLPAQGNMTKCILSTNVAETR